MEKWLENTPPKRCGNKHAEETRHKSERATGGYAATSTLRAKIGKFLYLSTRRYHYTITSIFLFKRIIRYIFTQKFQFWKDKILKKASVYGYLKLRFKHYYSLHAAHISRAHKAECNCKECNSEISLLSCRSSSKIKSCSSCFAYFVHKFFTRL